MLIDTAVFIDYLRGHEKAADAVRAARAQGEVFIHAVVAAELIAGVLDRPELRRTASLVSSCRLVVPDESDLRRALRLLERHVLADGVEWNDCVVAATALRMGRPVVTPNEKHFRVFRGLKIIRY